MTSRVKLIVRQARYQLCLWNFTITIGPRIILIWNAITSNYCSSPRLRPLVLELRSISIKAVRYISINTYLLQYPSRQLPQPPRPVLTRMPSIKCPRFTSLMQTARERRLGLVRTSPQRVIDCRLRVALDGQQRNHLQQLRHQREDRLGYQWLRLHDVTVYQRQCAVRCHAIDRRVVDLQLV